MSPIPSLQIIFYLVLLFLPKGTTQFTLSSGRPEKITWVHQAGGGWQATDDHGKDNGVWSTNAAGVSISYQGVNETADVSKFVKLSSTDGQTNQVSVLNQPVMISTSPTTLTFTQSKEGLFDKPIVITYPSK
jgi:hypothetical protein